jgi:hypothetical protein
VASGNALRASRDTNDDACGSANGDPNDDANGDTNRDINADSRSDSNAPLSADTRATHSATLITALLAARIDASPLVAEHIDWALAAA